MVDPKWRPTQFNSLLPCWSLMDQVRVSSRSWSMSQNCAPHSARHSEWTVEHGRFTYVMILWTPGTRKKKCKHWCYVLVYGKQKNSEDSNSEYRYAISLLIWASEIDVIILLLVFLPSPGETWPRRDRRSVTESHSTLYCVLAICMEWFWSDWMSACWASLTSMQLRSVRRSRSIELNWRLNWPAYRKKITWWRSKH